MSAQAPTPSPAPAAPPPEEDIRVLAVSSLMGDVRDFLLERQKHDHSALPWNLRGQEEQARAIEQAEAAATALVQKVTRLVMSQGRPVVVGKIKRAAKKDVIEAVVAVDPLAPLRHALMDAIGKEALIVLADSDAFMGDRGRPKVRPDQGGLFPGDGDDGDDGPVFDNTPSGKG